MSVQFKLSEQNKKWGNISSNKERLQRLHTSEDLSIFEIAYKYDVPAREVKQCLRGLNIHIVGPIDWKDDKDVLRKVAEDGAESEFADLLTGAVNSRHVKDRIETYEFKEYTDDHTNKKVFKNVLREEESVRAVAERFGIHEDTVSYWTDNHFDDNDAEKIVSSENYFDDEEEKEQENSSTVDINMESLIESGEISVDTSTNGNSIEATLEFVTDDIIIVEEEMTVELVDVEKRLREQLL
jgi:transposase-like protein